MPTPPFANSLYDDGYRERLMPAFDQAYGSFIRQFGQAESTLSFHLEQLALKLVGNGDLQKDIVRALLGSRRTPELANTTKLCLKAAIRAGLDHTQGDIDQVSDLFAQLSEIRFLRDRTAHYAMHPDCIRDGFVYFRSLNRYTVSDLTKTEEILFRIEHLEAATLDLKTICTRFPFALLLYQRPNPAGPQNPVQRPPWLYKSSDLIRTPYEKPGVSK